MWRDASCPRAAGSWTCSIRIPGDCLPSQRQCLSKTPLSVRLAGRLNTDPRVDCREIGRSVVSRLFHTSRDKVNTDTLSRTRLSGHHSYAGATPERRCPGRAIVWSSLDCVHSPKIVSVGFMCSPAAAACACVIYKYILQYSSPGLCKYMTAVCYPYFVSILGVVGQLYTRTHF